METRMLIRIFSKIQFISSNFSTSLIMDLVYLIYPNDNVSSLTRGERKKFETTPEKVAQKYAQPKVTDLTDKLRTWQIKMFTCLEKVPNCQIVPKFTFNCSIA